MNTEIFNIENITFDTTVKTKDEALQYIASFAKECEIVKSSKAYLKGLKKREKEVTTGFKDGIAIPHCKSKTVQKPALMIIKFSNPIDWEALDGNPVYLTFALAIPERKNEFHLKLLSLVSRSLIDEEFKKEILAANTKEDIYNIIQKKLKNMN